MLDSCHFRYCTGVDNLAVVGAACVVEEDNPAALDLTYCSHPMLGWRMRPCRLNLEYQLNLAVFVTSDLERTATMIDSSLVRVVDATMDSLETVAGSVVAPSSYRLVVADTYRLHWVITQIGVAWYWRLDKRMVVHTTAVVLAAACTMTVVFAAVAAEGIAAFAAVDRDN